VVRGRGRRLQLHGPGDGEVLRRLPETRGGSPRAEIAAFYPDVFMTLGTRPASANAGTTTPKTAGRCSCSHAWILDRDPPWLSRHLDAPLVPVGDWYYLDKLVATLQAYWAPSETPRPQAGLPGEGE